LCLHEQEGLQFAEIGAGSDRERVTEQRSANGTRTVHAVSRII